MGAPARFISGVSTKAVGHPLANYPMPDPLHSGGAGYGVSTYVNDFNTLIGTDYTVTGTSSTFALTTDLLGGGAVLTPGGATTASSAYKAAPFAGFVAGQQFWFIARCKASAVAGNVAFYAGLQAGSSANDGLWFAKAAASTSVNLVSTVSSAATTLVTGVATAVADTFLDLAFWYNGTDLLVYSNDAIVARVTAPTIGTTITSALMGPVFQITPTATDTLTVDYVFVAFECNR
jgi:hypothetical protein